MAKGGREFQTHLDPYGICSFIQHPYVQSLFQLKTPLYHDQIKQISNAQLSKSTKRKKGIPSFRVVRRLVKSWCLKAWHKRGRSRFMLLWPQRTHQRNKGSMLIRGLVFAEMHLQKCRVCIYREQNILFLLTSVIPVKPNSSNASLTG